MTNKSDIFNILESVLNEADPTPAEVAKAADEKAAAGADIAAANDASTSAAHPENATTYALRIASWIERLNRYSEDRFTNAANKIGLTVSKALKPLAIKKGPSKLSPEPADDEKSEGKFYENLRWEIPDDMKYRMFVIDKMNSEKAMGAEEKVLGALLGGVKLPTVSYGADIKYNPEYLQQYNKLLGSITKVIVSNNVAMANQNKKKKEEAETAVEEEDKIIAAAAATTAEDKSAPLAIAQQPKPVAIAYQPATKDQKQIGVAGKPAQIGTDKEVPAAVGSDKAGQKAIPDNRNAETKRITDANTANPEKTSADTSAVNSSFQQIIDDVLFEANDTTAAISSKIGAFGAHAISTIANKTGLPVALTKVRNLLPTIASLAKPGIYTMIGYDFGYISNGERLTTPKIVKRINVKNAANLMQFIENSHVYEDASGKIRKPNAGQKSDMHQIKPVKMVIFRIPKENSYENMNDEDILDPNNNITKEEISKLLSADSPKAITNYLSALPANTLAIAYWGRIIQTNEINEADEGKKVLPRQVVLTTPNRPEWYFLIPSRKKIDNTVIKNLKDNADDVPAAEPKKDMTKAVALTTPQDKAVEKSLILKAKDGALTVQDKEKAKALAIANPVEVANEVIKNIPGLDPEYANVLKTKKTRDEIKNDLRSIMRKLSVANHPDKNPNNPEALNKFRKIQAEYELLQSLGFKESLMSKIFGGIL